MRFSKFFAAAVLFMNSWNCLAEDQSHDINTVVQIPQYTMAVEALLNEMRMDPNHRHTMSLWGMKLVPYSVKDIKGTYVTDESGALKSIHLDSISFSVSHVPVVSMVDATLNMSANVNADCTLDMPTRSYTVLKPDGGLARGVLEFDLTGDHYQLKAYGDALMQSLLNSEGLKQFCPQAYDTSAVVFAG